MIFEASTAKTAQTQQISSLLDRCFVPGGKGHYFDDFPVWRHALTSVQLGASTPSQFLTLEVEGVLASVGAIRIARLRVPGQADVPVGLIGAIATDQQFRGRGLASKIVEALVEWGDRRGLPAMALWSGDARFYSRYGFSLGGLQGRASVGSLTAKGDGLSTTIEVCEGWDDAIWKLRCQQRSGLALELSDLEWYSKHLNVQWFRAYRGDSCRGELLGYLGFGRGIDLPGMVHEWGGSPEAVLTLLNSVAIKDPGAQWIFDPQAFKRVGFEIPGSTIFEYLALMRFTGPLAGFGTQWRSQLEDFSAVFGKSPDRATSPGAKPGLEIWFGGLDSC